MSQSRQLDIDKRQAEQLEQLEAVAPRARKGDAPPRGPTDPPRGSHRTLPYTMGPVSTSSRRSESEKSEVARRESRILRFDFRQVGEIAPGPGQGPRIWGDFEAYHLQSVVLTRLRECTSVTVCVKGCGLLYNALEESAMSVSSGATCGGYERRGGYVFGMTEEEWCSLSPKARRGLTNVTPGGVVQLSGDEMLLVVHASARAARPSLSLSVSYQDCDVLLDNVAREPLAAQSILQEWLGLHGISVDLG